MKKGLLFLVTALVLFSIGTLLEPSMNLVLIFIAATLVGLGVEIFFGEDKYKV